MDHLGIKAELIGQIGKEWLGERKWRYRKRSGWPSMPNGLSKNRSSVATIAKLVFELILSFLRGELDAYCRI